jgi:hypothetical protein
MPEPQDIDLAASIRALSQRMDCFYSWATQLQHEIRELKRAQPAPPARSEDEETSFLRRVGALKP